MTIDEAAVSLGEKLKKFAGYRGCEVQEMYSKKAVVVIVSDYNAEVMRECPTTHEGYEVWQHKRFNAEKSPI